MFAEVAVTGATRGEGAAGAVLVVAETGNNGTSLCEQLKGGVSRAVYVAGRMDLCGPTAVGLELIIFGASFLTAGRVFCHTTQTLLVSWLR